MDSDESYLCNDNFSRDLDNLFCGFFTCCANLLKEEDAYDPFDQAYVVSIHHQRVHLVQFVSPNKNNGNIQDPLITLSNTNKAGMQGVFTPSPFF